MVELLSERDVTVHDLAAEFDVSLSTVRRDLAALADRGRIMRTYGGAVEYRAVEQSWHDKARVHRSEKDAIAEVAASLVNAGDVVLLDAGSTVARLASRLRDRTDVTIVTNGLSTLIELADAEVDVVVLGGRLRRPNEAFLGTWTEQALRRLSPDLAFLGVDGLDPVRGINCPDYEQAALKEAMAGSARATWVLADHSKLAGAGRFPYWAAVPAGAGLITGAESGLAAFTEARWVVRRTESAPAVPPPGED
jgi:DeoR/GlpR family transcriptional regulator of sugar metabolism